MGICSFSAYCINTGLGSVSSFDGIYSAAGVYNTYLYYTGDTTSPSYLFFDTLTTSWCLSTSLGGSCSLFGNNTCYGDCPNLDEGYFSTGICPSPTPTMTPHCYVDFNSIFDCNVAPSPTPTTTTTPTTTPTPTPTPTEACVLNLLVYVANTTPPPTPTPTMTPSSTSSATCATIGGVVSYNMLDGNLICNTKNKYQDCVTGTFYYTSNIPTLNGVVISAGTVCNAVIDGSYSCVTYIGTELIAVIENNIILQGVTYSACTDCFPPSPTPTPTPSITPTLTRTPTPTPTPSHTVGFYICHVYRNCLRDHFFVDTVNPPMNLNGGAPLVPGDSFCWENTSGLYTGLECIQYVGRYFGLFNGVVQGGGLPFDGLTWNGSNYMPPIYSGPGDYFKNNGQPCPITIITSCADCASLI